MYIKYCEIFETIALFMPITLRPKIRKLGFDLKVWQNLSYISKNLKQVIKNLKEKIKKGEKLNVAFFIYDDTKWKCQSIYDLMEESKFFKPHIFITKNCSPKNNFNYQPKETLPKIYNFFKENENKYF